MWEWWSMQYVCWLHVAQAGGFNLGGWQGDFLLICGYGDNEWLKSETWVELGATSLAGDSELWAGDWTLTVGCFTDAHSSYNYEGHRRRRTKTTSSWSIYCYSEKNTTANIISSEANKLCDSCNMNISKRFTSIALQVCYVGPWRWTTSPLHWNSCLGIYSVSRAADTTAISLPSGRLSLSNRIKATITSTFL